MNEKDVSWDDLNLFLAVARDGGLSPAARATGRSPATLGRRMLALERALGRELFARHDRGYALTDEGRAMRDELAEVETRITQITARPAAETLPLVKISAGSWTVLHLLDLLDALTGTPPDLRLRFAAAEAALDIAHREVVIGIRNQRPREASLAGRKTARNEFAPYALKGAEDRPWVKVLADTPSARWLDARVGRDAIFEVTAPRNSLDIVRAGRGKALLPTFIGDREPGLVRVGDTVPELAHDQWVVTHHDDRHLPEVRRVLTRLYAALARG
ncbi:LysR family transcriptional regulator [Litoreibacter ponti]|uniref:LysR family transcriptional regulator n=1 Tax=Litoreibacter ponti TaxID=1510457 RepID=A0A2T6BDV9_9RHOB|nr:LysR family transcriptional regulator [Litoreibacter ponti]PTX54253.1 LysR family transcriptional regulator [Litoreibacter ponti]